MAIDLKAVLSKTPKGFKELSSKKWSLFGNPRQKVLELIDGRSNVQNLIEASGLPEEKFFAAAEELIGEELIRVIEKQATVQEAPAQDLDFTKDIHLSIADTQAFRQAMENFQQPGTTTPMPPPAKPAKPEAKPAQEAKAKKDNLAERIAQLEVEQAAHDEEKQRRKEAKEIQARQQAEEEARQEQMRRAQAEKTRHEQEEAARKAREAAELQRKEEELRHKEEALRHREEELRHKAEKDRRAREEAERKAREQAEQQQREEELLRKQEEEERRQRRLAARAREEAEQKAAEEKRAREEAERKARDEEARHQREEAERRQREEEQKRIREEAERKAREEMEHLLEQERKAREEAERKAEEERRARAEAERKAEEERQAKQEAERRAREEAERKVEEEHRAREEAERKARKEAEERARAEAERKLEEERRAREEAERKAEEERRAREEAQRKAEEERLAREEAERQSREKEEQRQREEQERQHQVAEAQRQQEEARKEEARQAEAERDRQAKKEEQRRKEEQAARAEAETRARQEAERIARERAEEKLKERERRAEVSVAAETEPAPAGRKWIKYVAIAVPLVAVGIIVALPLVPLGSHLPKFEAAASAALGEPVKASGLSLSILPSPKLSLNGVSVGQEGAMHIDKLVLQGSLGTLTGGGHYDSISAGKASLPVNALPRLAKWLETSKAGKTRVTRLNIERLEVTGQDFPPLQASLTFSSEGALATLRLASTDKRLSLDYGDGKLSFSARDWTPVRALPLAFSELDASTTVTGEAIRFDELRGRVQDGEVRGNARISWNGDWTLRGELSVSKANLGSAAAKPGDKPAEKTGDRPGLRGEMNGTFSFAQTASQPEGLLRQPRVNGSFTVKGGAITNFDLGRVVLYEVEAVYAGETPFTELSAGIEPSGDRHVIKNVRLNNEELQASGQLDIAADTILTGLVKLQVQQKKKSAKGDYAVSGTLEKPTLKKVR